MEITWLLHISRYSAAPPSNWPNRAKTALFDPKTGLFGILAGTSGRFRTGFRRRFGCERRQFGRIGIPLTHRQLSRKPAFWEAAATHCGERNLGQRARRLGNPDALLLTRFGRVAAWTWFLDLDFCIRKARLQGRPEELEMRDVLIKDRQPVLAASDLGIGFAQHF